MESLLHGKYFVRWLPLFDSKMPRVIKSSLFKCSSRLTQTFPTTWASEHCKGPSEMHLRTAKRAKAVCTNSSPPPYSPPKKNPSQQPFKKALNCTSRGLSVSDIYKWLEDEELSQSLVGKEESFKVKPLSASNVGRCFVYTRSAVWFMTGPYIQNFSWWSCRERGWERNQEFVQ